MTRPQQAREGAAYAAPAASGLPQAHTGRAIVVSRKTLEAPPASLLPGRVPAVSKNDIERALQPAPLIVDPASLRRLLTTSHLDDGNNSLAQRLCACAAADVSELAFNAIGARRRCGRRYALAVPATPSHLLLTTRQVDDWTYDKAGPRRFRAGLPKAAYLANIPRSVRKAFAAPQGSLLIDFDIRSAHHAIAAGISGDPALLTAVSEGIHAVTGTLLAPHLPPEIRYQVGKRCNSALQACCGPEGLLEQLNKAGVSTTLPQAEDALRGWWARFPTLARFVRACFVWVDQIRRSGRNLKLADGDRTLAYYDRAFIGGRVWHRDQDGRFYKGVTDLQRPPRSIWTGILRGIESLLMDRIFMAAHGLGLRLAMPLYDGALWVAEADRAHELAGTLKIAADDILREAGIPTEGKIKVRRSWG